MINARAETIADKPAFRHAIKYRRCLVPASGLFERMPEGKNKRPMYIRLKTGSPMVFAAIWDKWKSPEGEGVESFAILTTSSNKLIEPLHDRQPVIFHPHEFDLWLNREVNEPDSLKTLYYPYPPDLMEMYPVSMFVNSPRNDSPEIIEPTLN
jgi:putative SOS response-associated peptidase YedK